MKSSLSLIALFSSASAFVRPAFVRPAYFKPSSTNHLIKKNEFKQDYSKRSFTTSIQSFMVDTIESVIAMESTNVLASQQGLLEAEFFADLAHIILDFATLFSPDTLLLRLLIMVGRVFNILSDVIPDQYMTTDEIVVQSSMLTLSSHKFVKMLLPLVLSMEQTASFQDRRMFFTVFQPAGFTWQQYKFLLSNGALEWVKVPAQSTICGSSQNLLLTHKGALFKVDSHRDPRVYGRRNGRCTHDFIGDLSLFKDLLDNACGKKKSLSIKKVDTHTIDSDDTCPSDFQIFHTESQRAVLMRINTSTLLSSVKDDSRIAEGAKNLIFNAIQDRLKSYDSTTSGSNETNRTDVSLFSYQL